MKRGKPMRRRSKKMAHEYEKEGGRRDVVARLLAVDGYGLRPRCDLFLSGSIPGTTGCTIYATQIHEVLRRSAGGAIVDFSNLKRLCAECHRYIHEHPAWSRANGWLRSRYGQRDDEVTT